MPYSRRTTFAALPLAAFAILSPQLGGGAAPAGSVPVLPVSVDRHIADYGSTVRVTGRTSAGADRHISVVFTPSGGVARVVAATKASRQGVWAARIQLRASGRVSARQANAAQIAAAATGTPVVVRSSLSVTDATVTGTGGRLAIAAHSAPSIRKRWWLERHNTRGWTRVASGLSTRTGRIKTSSRITSGQLRLRVAATGSVVGVAARVRAHRFRPALASWYGLYGDAVACGGVLHRNTIGVAHKTLPCGTRLTIRYRGRSVVARVIDRGPYIAGREFDLTGGAARALHFDGVDTIWVSR